MALPFRLFIAAAALCGAFSVAVQNVCAQTTFQMPAEDVKPEAKPKKPKKLTSEEQIKKKSEKIKNPTAVFDGLDKITARITSIESDMGKMVQFGALKVTPRVCYTRPYSDNPQTSAFVEVDEVGLTGEIKRIFTGWMFADSPGLNGVEHPVFDVWLKTCKGGNQGKIEEGPKTGYDGDGPSLKPSAPEKLPEKPVTIKPKTQQR